jgi:hypothetical protein
MNQYVLYKDVQMVFKQIQRYNILPYLPTLQIFQQLGIKTQCVLIYVHHIYIVYVNNILKNHVLIMLGMVQKYLSLNRYQHYLIWMFFMIAYQDKLQESNKSIKKTNITFHTSNPDLDGRTLEPILKMNLESGHVKTRLASTITSNPSPQEQTDKNQSSFIVNKPSLNHHDNVSELITRNSIHFFIYFSLRIKHQIVVMLMVVLIIT